MEDILYIREDGSVDANEYATRWEPVAYPNDDNNGDDDDDDDTSDDKQESDVKEESSKFEPFKDLYKRRFLWYYEHYMLTVEQSQPRYKDGTAFEKMPFENKGNSMDGQFSYAGLGKRLIRIKEVLNQETEKWAAEGLLLKKDESSKAANLQRQFEQQSEHLKQKKVFNLSVELDDSNPFVWILTYFGKPMTHLDGGVFKIKICISPRFPDEQPRVRVETPLYHHRVSKDGILCYFPKKLEDMKNHVQSIVDALEEESPPFDPRTIVHPEASKLLWGAESEKKQYFRQLRRSAQRSMEME